MISPANSTTTEDKQKMLESAEWKKVNKCCYVFVVGETGRVIATVYTSSDPDNPDENQIWDADIEEDSIGTYFGLYCAQQAVQTIFCAVEKDSEDKKKRAKATAEKKKATKVKNVKQN